MEQDETTRTSRPGLSFWLLSLLSLLVAILVGLMPEKTKEVVFPGLLATFRSLGVTVAYILLLVAFFSQWKRWSHSLILSVVLVFSMPYAFYMGWTRVEGLLDEPKSTAALTPPVDSEEAPPPLSPCLWYNVTIDEFEVLECNDTSCTSDMIYQLTTHHKTRSDTIFTQGPGTTKVDLRITHNKVDYAPLRIYLAIKTMKGITLAELRKSWEYEDNWGEGPGEVLGSGLYMTYKIRYTIECEPRPATQSTPET